jgi:hypothetical protein
MYRALSGREEISMMKQLTLSLVLLVAMMAIAVEAQATTITGGISFIGFANPVGGADWSTATGVAFLNPAVAGSGTGSYAGISAPTTFTNFTYDPGLSPSPVHLWTFNSSGLTYSFDLSSLTSVVKAGNGSLNSVVINGGGTLHITGLDDTAGTFVFSGNGANGSYSFSASDGTSVPEPASVLLLGIGLLGIVGLTHRQMKRQNQQL